MQPNEDALKVTKQVSKDGDDGESIYLYLVTNDIDVTTDKILKIYQRRWKIEEYHKSLKQNLKIEHSPIKVVTSQVNHKMNHFALKEKIYIEALRLAYQKVLELECAWFGSVLGKFTVWVYRNIRFHFDSKLVSFPIIA